MPRLSTTISWEKVKSLSDIQGENFREDLGPHGVASWPLLTGGCASPSSWSQTAVSVHSAATAGIRIEGRGANKMCCAIMCPAFVIPKFPKCCFENNNYSWVTWLTWQYQVPTHIWDILFLSISVNFIWYSQLRRPLIPNNQMWPQKDLWWGPAFNFCWSVK